MVENPEDPPLHNHTLHDKLVNMDGFEYMLLPGRDEDIFGKVYTCKKHALVKSKAVGTVFVVVMDWSKESMTRLHNACANQDKPLRNRGEINAKGFFIALPEWNDFVVWRTKWGAGEEKDDFVKSWSNSIKDYDSQEQSGMRGLRGELYGPKEQHRQGHGGSQRNLEGPAVNSKRYGRRLDDLGDLQKRLLARGAQCGVRGLAKVDGQWKENVRTQAEVSNCARVGCDENLFWASAQLNIASLDHVPNEVSSVVPVKGGNELREKRKAPGLIHDIGQSGGPHNDGGDHEGMVSHMMNWSEPRADVYEEYFTIFDLGCCWRLDELCSIYFSGLYYHSGASAIPKDDFDGASTYTRMTLIMYPSARELEGDSQVAMGFIPMEPRHGLLTLNVEMRNFASHAYADRGLTTYGNYIADGLSFMTEQSYLNHLSRNFLCFVTYMIRQAPMDGLVRVDKEKFLSAFSMRDGNVQIGTQPWELGPGWTGDDVRIGKIYENDFDAMSEEECLQLWNSDTGSDLPFGNKGIRLQREVWKEYKMQAMQVLPICHASGEVDEVDSIRHGNYRRIIRDQAMRKAQSKVQNQVKKAVKGQIKRASSKRVNVKGKVKIGVGRKQGEHNMEEIEVDREDVRVTKASLGASDGKGKKPDGVTVGQLVPPPTSGSPFNAGYQPFVSFPAI
ncbi:uncharacterized protein C8R40DRAFT_1169900 [Lentinula edodes]|uniref:uncharacterized protein n=1 Tax=Lentinula edodes TaxID=5353 RepID=UPI001E8D582A|nr:uncharacterized protein C8R40DRAFT_1169900 [Lentinula edodes]KAH7875772.1 hypothetical protein C8R40DRAFT_1169900 [Lentinula edodes]